MAETSSSEMIELHFDDVFRIDRLPFHRMLGAPSAQTPWRFSRKAWRLHHFLELLRQLLTVFVADGRSEANVIQQTLVIV
jgi:hypothetical protein